MQEGNLRADVNVSVRPKGSDTLGTRCEIKNMNSMRFIMQAMEFEARRQIGILEDGGVVEQETRLYDPNRGETRSMRSKEEAHDYRYFPDPDLLPLELEQDWIDAIGASLPELPDARKARYVAELRDDRVRRGGADRRGGDGAVFRGGGGGARRQAGGELGDQRALRAAEQGGARARGESGRARAARRADRSGGLGRDLGQDRQGRLRDPLDRGRGSGHNRRRAGPAPGDRHRGDRGGGGRGGGGQPGEGGAGAWPSRRSPAGSWAR